MATRAERIDDYRIRLTADVQAVLRDYGITAHGPNDEFYVALVDELVEAAMHSIEHLVMEATT